MAPPSSSLPLGERLKALAQTLQYALLALTFLLTLTVLSLQVFLVCWVCLDCPSLRPYRLKDMNMKLASGLDD